MPGRSAGLVGEGPEKENVQQRAKQLGIEDKVTFVGVSCEVEQCLGQADVFVLCSTFEGLPLSILEAYASGLPVIATKVGGVPDILEDGVNGFLVTLNDQDEMEEAMLKLYQDPRLRAQISCVNLEMTELFDIKKTATLYKTLYAKHGEKHETI